jgi:hypothetical protein
MEKKVGEKMQEEVNEKTVALCVKGGKISAEILKTAMRKFLHSMEQARSEKGKKHTRAPNQKKDVVSHGKQSIKKLQKGGSQLTNIEITEKNIKSFEKVARKYGVDYSLKKDKSVTPPRYLVIFRAKDVDTMTVAFKEYAGVAMKKEQRVSIRKKLQLAKERVAKHREREKSKDKDRGEVL